MERSSTPVPSPKQVKESVETVKKNANSSDTLVNDYLHSLSGCIDLNRINPKDLDSFINTFSSKTLEENAYAQHQRMKISKARNAIKIIDPPITVDQTLSYRKTRDDREKVDKSMECPCTADCLLMKNGHYNKNKETESASVRRRKFAENSSKSGYVKIKFHKNGAAVVKVSISETFRWTKTNHNMYSNIEKNPELISNLTKEQLDFLQVCFENVCLCIAELNFREKMEEAASDAATINSEETVKLDCIADIIFNESTYENIDEQEEKLEAVPRKPIDLEESLEQLCQLDEDCSSYLDFESSSTCLDSIEQYDNDDFITPKPFIEQLFEEKINKASKISYLNNPNFLAEDNINISSGDLTEPKEKEQLCLTPVSSHCKSKAQNIKQNPKHVLDQMMGIKQQYRLGNACDNLF